MPFQMTDREKDPRHHFFVDKDRTPIYEMQFPRPKGIGFLCPTTGKISKSCWGLPGTIGGPMVSCHECKLSKDPATALYELNRRYASEFEVK